MIEKILNRKKRLEHTMERFALCWNHLHYLSLLFSHYRVVEMNGVVILICEEVQWQQPQQPSIAFRNFPHSKFLVSWRLTLINDIFAWFRG
jgi:hypothetical protein